MKNFVGVLCLMLGFLAYGQQTPDEELVPKDAKAKKILDKLSATTKGYASIGADFTYNLCNKDEKIDENQEGKIKLKGNMYRLEIAGQEVITNGATVWTVIHDAEEVQIDNVSDEEEDETLNPSKLFTLYEEGFKYKYIGEEQADGKTVHVIKLFPIDAGEKPFHTIILSIIKVEMQILSIQILSKDGNKYTYKLKNFEGGIDVPDDHFEFDVKEFPDYEVIDLREDG